MQKRAVGRAFAWRTGRDSASALVVFRRLGLATASRSRLPAESAGHRSGVRSLARAKQLARSSPP